MSNIVINLPQDPSTKLAPDVYAAMAQVHLAITNLVREIGELTGVDAYPSSDWSNLPASTTILTGNATRLYLPAGVAITRGQLVNIYDDAGTIKVRLADADSATTMAHGIANSSGIIGEIIEVNWLRTYSNAVSGLVAGSLYWLSTTAGSVQNTPPVSPGQIQQPVGVALSATSLLVDIPLSYIQL